MYNETTPELGFRFSDLGLLYSLGSRIADHLVCHFVITLSALWDHSEGTFGLLWGHFGITLRSLWDHSVRVAASGIASEDSGIASEDT